MLSCRSSFNECAKTAAIVGLAALSAFGGTTVAAGLLMAAGVTAPVSAPLALAVGIYSGRTTANVVNGIIRRSSRSPST